MVPEPALLARFQDDLDALSATSERIGVAVSGGPDSLALLVLAAAARPGSIEAASVDHALRAGSRAEAEMVAGFCENLGVPHEILTAEWAEPPVTAIQERARDMRYRLLASWVSERKLDALVTAHHADDQAETMVMRLNRGSGVRGLAGMRPSATVPGSAVPLLRPLLHWQRSELEGLCRTANLAPASDPGNSDEQFERVRIRRALVDSDLLDAQAVSRSAAHLADADQALDWIAQSLSLARITGDDGALRIDPDGLPREILRRLVRLAFARFDAPEPRGGDLERALDALERGQVATLSGLKLEGGKSWHLTKAPARARTRPVDNLR